jgi:hypothetical protein
VEIAMLAKDLPTARFWAIWFVALLLAAGFALPAIIHAIRWW